MRDLFELLYSLRFNGIVAHYTSYETARIICHTRTMYFKRIDVFDDALEGQSLLGLFNEESEHLYKEQKLSSFIFNKINHFE